LQRKEEGGPQLTCGSEDERANFSGFYGRTIDQFELTSKDFEKLKSYRMIQNIQVLSDGR